MKHSIRGMPAKSSGTNTFVHHARSGLDRLNSAIDAMACSLQLGGPIALPLSACACMHAARVSLERPASAVDQAPFSQHSAHQSCQLCPLRWPSAPATALPPAWLLAVDQVSVLLLKRQPSLELHSPADERTLRGGGQWHGGLLLQALDALWQRYLVIVISDCCRLFLQQPQAVSMARACSASSHDACTAAGA